MEGPPRPGTSPADDVSRLLRAWSDGDQGALEVLTPIVYAELHRLARHYMQRERPGHSLQATALVNEAFLQLSAERTRQFQNRSHFVAIAALSMRQILVQRARARNAAKRGGGVERVTFDERALSAPAPTGGTDAMDLVALDDALSRLATLDPEQARIVELRYFGGLTIDETAEAVGVSPATVKRQWTMARAWLKLQLESA
jgi:RNA polymerase sigma factor (TIGR02999 family)